MRLLIRASSATLVPAWAASWFAKVVHHAPHQLFLPAIRECFDLCQFRSFHGLRAGGVAVGGRRAAYVFGFSTDQMNV